MKVHVIHTLVMELKRQNILHQISKLNKKCRVISARRQAQMCIVGVRLVLRGYRHVMLAGICP